MRQLRSQMVALEFQTCSKFRRAIKRQNFHIQRVRPIVKQMRVYVQVTISRSQRPRAPIVKPALGIMQNYEK